MPLREEAYGRTVFSVWACRLEGMPRAFGTLVLTFFKGLCGAAGEVLKQVEGQSCCAAMEVRKKKEKPG